MSDLISRSVLLEEIKKYKFGAISNDAEREYVKDTILNFIEFQPTAYDIDKVVEELDCDRCESCSLLEVCAGSKCCTLCHKKIIEIVKQGGISDDVCEWKQDKGCVGLGAYNISCCDKTLEMPVSTAR